MTDHPPADPALEPSDLTDQGIEARARAYIDRAIAVQQALGYTSPVPPALYEQAVRAVARASRQLARAAARYAD